MKRFILLISFIFLSTYFFQQYNWIDDAGITPSNPLYILDTLVEDVSIHLSFNKEQKAKKLIVYANERLAEYEKLNQKDKQKWGNTLLLDYDDSLQSANQLMQVDYSNEASIDEQLTETVTNYENLANDLKSKVSNTISKQIQQTIAQTKLTLFIEVTNIKQSEQLLQEGFTYNQILELKAISELTDQSIDKLLEIDGFIIKTDEEVTINYTALYHYYKEKNKVELYEQIMNQITE